MKLLENIAKQGDESIIQELELTAESTIFENICEVSFDLVYIYEQQINFL